LIDIRVQTLSAKVATKIGLVLIIASAAFLGWWPKAQQRDRVLKQHASSDGQTVCDKRDLP